MKKTEQKAKEKTGGKASTVLETKFGISNETENAMRVGKGNGTETQSGQDGRGEKSLSNGTIT